MNTDNETVIPIIEVLIVEPGKQPQIKTIEDTLLAMQKVVGGNIETFPLEDGAVLVCDEEGKLKGKPVNRVIRIYDSKTGKFENIDIIAGTFFVCYAPEGSEEFYSLPQRLQEKFTNLFSECLRFDIGDKCNEFKKQR